MYTTEGVKGWFRGNH